MTKARESVAVLNAVASVVRHTGTDTAALTSALAVATSGGRIAIPAGSRAWAQNGAALFSAAGKTVLSGDGAASVVTDTEQSVAGVSTLFTMQAVGFTVADFALNLAKSSSGGVPTIIGVQPAFNDYNMVGMRIDGGNVLSSGTADRSTQLVKASTAVGIEGVTLAGNYAENFSRAYTRDNANTATHSRVKSFFNVWKKAWRTVLTFNAPSGSIEDVCVIGETFDTHEGTVQNDSALSGNNNAVGFVGVRGGRAIGNHVSGLYGALTHTEENSDCIVVAANTARMRNASSTNGAMETLANNVGGVAVVPQHQVWMGNALQSTDGVGKGAYLQSSVSSDATHWSLVISNVYAGFEEAYRTDTDARSVLASNNVLKGTVNAAELNRASLLFTHNVAQATSETIHTTRGGLIGAVHFVNLTSETGSITGMGASSNSPLALSEWTWETGLFTIPAGVSTLNVCPMPTRMYGRASIVLTVSGASYRHFEHAVSWDGATLTPASIVGLDLYYGAGSIDILQINNAGQLAIQFTNGGAQVTDVARIQIRFHSGQFIV